MQVLGIGQELALAANFTPFPLGYILNWFEPAILPRSKRNRPDFMNRTSNRPLVLSWLLLLGTAAWLYSTAFVLPNIPIFEGDVSPIFLHEAVRMLRGEIIYKDFYELLLPGIQYVDLALIKLFGLKAWIPNLMLVILGTGLAAAGYLISRRVLDGKLAYLPSALFLGFAFTSEPDPTHHWYSTLAVMAALGILMDRRTPARVALAGVLCGVAMMFTQTVGPAAAFGIALFLIWERRKRTLGWHEMMKAQAQLWVPFAVTVLVPVTCLIGRAGFVPFCTETILFPAKYFRLWFWNTPQVYLYEVPNFDGLLQIGAVALWLSIHVLVPGVYLVLLARWLRLRKVPHTEPWDRLMLLSLVGLCLFLTVVSSPSWLRLCSVSFPGLIVLVWLTRGSNWLSIIFRRALWIASAAALAAQPLIAQTNWRGNLATPAGREAFTSPDVYDKFNWMQQHTRPGEFVFQASDCSLYYLLELNNPARVTFLTASGYTRWEQVQETIQLLEKKHVHYVLWSVWLDVPFPDRPGSFDAARLDPMREYLRTHYRLVRNFGAPDYEQVWERTR